VVYLLSTLLTHPAFDVREVTVAGADSKAPELSTQAALQYVTQAVGTNIFRVSGAQLEEELQRIPSIRHARVLLVLPDRLVVQIVEREPKAIWRTRDSTFLVDAEGYIVAQGESPAVKLVIHDQEPRTLQPGETVDRHALSMAERLAVLLPEAGLPVQEFRYSARQGLLAVTETGSQVLVGYDTQPEARVAEVVGVLEVAKRRGEKVGLVDVRPDGRPYYQPEVTPTAAARPTPAAETRRPGTARATPTTPR
jgi:cell division septal protein FtsQ